MKKIKKLLFLCLLSCIFFLTGCGIEVNTEMTINENFNGEKVISCFVSKQDMNHHFKGESSKIKSMLENHCPACLEYEIVENSRGTDYVFTLPFSSLEGYKAALTTILNFSPEVTYKGVNSIFSKSIDLKENFTSIDLLRWFEILLTEEYDISSTQLEKLWNIRSTTVHWMDSSYSSSSDKIHISDHKLSDFDGISIFTEEQDDRSFIRKIQFSIPESTLNTRMIELEDTFEKIKPSGVTGIWTTTETGKIYEITFHADDFKSLSEKTGEALKAKSQNINVISSVSNYQYLKLYLEYSETLDFSTFLCTEQGEVPVSYYFKPNSYTVLNSERLQKEINNAFIPKVYDDGYYRIFNGNCSTLKITNLGTMHLPVQSCDIITEMESNHTFNREISFIIPDLLRDEEIGILTSHMKADSTKNLSVKLLDAKENYNLQIVQAGSCKDINESSHLLFGEEGNNIDIAELSFFDLLNKEKEMKIQDSISLSNYIGYKNDSFAVNYVFKDKTEHSRKDCYLVTGEEETIDPIASENTTCVFQTSSTEFTSYYVGTTPSFLGISIFLGLVICILIGILLFIKANPMKRRLSDEETPSDNL